jgi:hypothetical protein
MVPAFRDTLQRLFPDVGDDPDEALQLAGHLLALRRRLEQLAPEPAPQPQHQKPGWRFWRRT